MKPLSETQGDIQRLLEKHGVELGYVFGSYAQGKTGPLSDVDVAVVFAGGISRDEYFDKELQIAGDIGQLLKIDRVDVVNMETVASPLLKHRATIHGVCVLDLDHARRTQVEHRVLQEYEDTQNLRDSQYRAMSRQLKDGTFGKPIISPYAYGAD